MTHNEFEYVYYVFAFNRHAHVEPQINIWPQHNCTWFREAEREREIEIQNEKFKALDTSEMKYASMLVCKCACACYAVTLFLFTVNIRLKCEMCNVITEKRYCCTLRYMEL